MKKYYADQVGRIILSFCDSIKIRCGGGQTNFSHNQLFLTLRF